MSSSTYSSGFLDWKSYISEVRGKSPTQAEMLSIRCAESLAGNKRTQPATIHNQEHIIQMLMELLASTPTPTPLKDRL